MVKESTALVSWVHNKVEVTSDQPWAHVQIADILKLLQEGALIHITLGTIDPCEPPTLVFHDGDASINRIRGVVGLGDRDPRGLPSQQNPTTSAISRKVEELIKGGAQALPHQAVRNDHHLCLLNTNHSCISRRDRLIDS
jgi:hypothetical protein